MNAKLAEAQKSLARAAYLVHRTYPEVKEPKLFLSIADALAAAMIQGIGSIMDDERSHMRMLTQFTDLDSEITLFRKHCAPKYKINDDFIIVLRKCMDILKAQKESPVAFVRAGKYVMCTQEYEENMAIDEKMMKEYLSTTESFLRQVEAIPHA